MDAPPSFAALRETHPAAETAERNLRERISHFCGAMRERADAVLELSLFQALLAHPEPTGRVREGELLQWLHCRLYDVARGGNDFFQLPDTFRAIFETYGRSAFYAHRFPDAPPEHEARHTFFLALQALVRTHDAHQVETWRQAMYRERLRLNLRHVEHHIQHRLSQALTLGPAETVPEAELAHPAETLHPDAQETLALVLV
jgi:hypothetical protein